MIPDKMLLDSPNVAILYEKYIAAREEAASNNHWISWLKATHFFIKKDSLLGRLVKYLQ